MTSLDIIKSKTQRLYRTNPNIHITSAIPSTKANFRNEPVVIKGVYPHIIQIEEKSTGFPKLHSLQYTEVLLHHVEIAELGDTRFAEQR